MVTIRLTTLLTAMVVTQVSGADSCYVPGEQPGDGVGEGVCAPDAPEPGCPCAEDGTLGCEDDGFTHDTAFLCKGGVWIDAYGNPEADALFCDSPELEYNFCAWVDGAVMTNCTVK